MVEKGTNLAKTALYAIDSGKVTNKTNYVTVDDARYGLKPSAFVQTALEIVLEPQSITSVMVTANAKGRLYFDHDYERVIQSVYLPKE